MKNHLDNVQLKYRFVVHETFTRKDIVVKNVFVGALLVFTATLLSELVSAAESSVPPPAQWTTEHSTSPLRDYLAKEDTSFHWHKIREGEIAGTKYVELILTSQTWRQIVWKHRLFIVMPENVAANTNALLIIAGGKWKEEYADLSYEGSPVKEAVLFASLAQQLESPVAVLLQVPQQPIFDGKKEDEIISYTFEQYLDTGDPEWPLLLPMVRSAVKGMDAIQEFCEAEWSLSIDSFTVTGGSKRGWTTWLTGASDTRVTAIAPMVIDMLNLKVQMDHQQDTWGEFSEQIHDYTERNIPERMKTAAGEALLQIVDPLAYRESLKLPKLLILGTNDPYWTLDALNLYWSQLLGQKHILYVPNNGHGLQDFPRVLGGVQALHEQAAGGDKLPELTWSFDEARDKVTLSINSNVQPHKCQVWIATSKSSDFRESLWIASEMTASNDAYTFQVDLPKTGSKAFFGEVLFARKHLPLYLSTNVRIVRAAEVALPRDQGLSD